VPEVSRFHGIVIRQFHDDHAPPHFHALHSSGQASFVIETGLVLKGSLPPKEHRRVLEWLALHRAELAENWRRACEFQPLQRIAPLE
jgi:hypothetical protein